MMSAREAACIMHGELIGDDRPFSGVSTDTRTLRAGELFMALKGQNFDAAQFLHQAFVNGAAAAVVARDAIDEVKAVGPIIVVADTRGALGRLAAQWRGRFSLPVVGLTGSNGKTTVKEMIAAVLAAKCGCTSEVLATQGNLNNDIGLPLTLLRLRETHRYAVIEMGMNHAGEIRYLTGLARPNVALVTNAGVAHIGMLGSREAIAHAKGEIFEAADRQCTAVINADDAFAPYWRTLNAGRRIIEFGLDSPAAVTGTYKGHALASEIVIKTPAGCADVRLDVPGEHNVRNALAATAAGVALDVPVATIAKGLSGYGGTKGRLQVQRGIRGATLIDDAYNANPDSAVAAISVLAAATGKRVLVLADMGELGDMAAPMHADVGAAAASAGIDTLFTLGELAQRATQAFGVRGKHFSRIEDLLVAIETILDANTTVLVKGSRFMQMERVVRALAAGDQAP
jgi:UDP-N-acetylmuramoyl-tripeptide--D-alanyl-D-alanine ligase